MSDIIFPAGFIIDYPDLDLEMLKYRTKMWDLENDQLGKGVLKVSLWVAHTPRIQISITHASKAFLTRGGFPDGCIMLLYSSNELTNEFTTNVQNRSISPREIVILPKGDELDLLTYGTIDLHSIVIEEDLFYKEFYAFFGDTPDASIQNKRLYLKEDKILIFHQTVASWISYLTDEFLKLTNKPEYDTMESEILRQLFDCMVPAPLLKKRKKFQTKIVRDMLHENIDNDIDISTLTSELNISNSQLHHVFKKEYGITPKKYLLLLRFNAIRKVLLLSDPNSVTIEEVVYKYNIFHMGHFSAQYKNIFGETPSQTLHHHK